MSYQVIARKWRPQTFAEVTGQELITQTLRNAIEYDRLHHAYLFSGARGVVEKRSAPALLLKAIEKVHDGELWVDRAATSRIFMELARQKAAKGKDPEQQRIATLTKRERHSIAAVASDANAPGKVIAARLNISEHTLRNHLTSVYSKLGVPNRLALYAYAHRHGLHEVS